MTYKLTYFNARGRAEAARYLFALSGTKYEDVRIEKEQWAALKPKTPFGQLPVLTYNGREYCQSHAIVRFLARQFNFYGRTVLDGLLVDQIMGVVPDLLTEMNKLSAGSDEDKRKASENFKAEVLPKFLRFLEQQLGDRHWLVAGEVTAADAVVFSLLSGSETLESMQWKSMSPKLATFVDRFATLPRIKEYIATRPVTAL